MFKMKYEIKQRFLPNNTARRSGNKMAHVGFITAHDSGNPGSTAANNVSYYINSANDMSASAHIFADDIDIIECIPWLTVDEDEMEKAWHVVYNVTKDNEVYGDDANDIAGGIEYCYGGKIDAKESYKRYVWVTAYACYKFGLDPSKHITGHFILDPARKTDPKSGLAASLGITFEQYIQDVVNEYKECTQEDEEEMKLEQYQWKMLGDALDGLYHQGRISDYTWAEKAYKMELTQSELSWLNMIIGARSLGIEI